MQWTRASKYHSDSDQGYLISATAGLGGEGWRFMAWGPVRPGWEEVARYLRFGKSGRPPEEFGVKVHYGIGEPMPHPRSFLGVFGESDQAKTACDEHWRKHHDRAA